MHRAVFLDRDNTIIQNDGDLGDATAVQLLEGAAQSMVRLRDAGFLLVIVTNQSGVARGVFTEDDVAAVHDAIEQDLLDNTSREDLIQAWYYSPWHPEGVIETFRGDHPTRKPNPGMLVQASEDHRIDLSRSWMVGDQERDVQAGHAAGCRAIRLAHPGTESAAEMVCQTLAQATEQIMHAETTA
ncbi:MAG: HAD family hydrolase [Planctomycetota bacterium]|nr:HAD family hydrolase [Planctomycetota bacterium]